MITHKFQCKAIKAPASDKYLPVLIRKANEDLTTYHLLINVSTDKNKIAPILLPINIIVTAIKGMLFKQRSIYIAVEFLNKTPNLMDVLKEHFGELCTKSTKLIIISSCSQLHKVDCAEIDIAIKEETEDKFVTNDSCTALASFITNWEQEISKKIPPIEINKKAEQQLYTGVYTMAMQNNYQIAPDPTDRNTAQQMVASDTTQTIRSTEEEPEMMLTEEEPEMMLTEEGYTEEATPQTILSGSNVEKASHNTLECTKFTQK